MTTVTSDDTTFDHVPSTWWRELSACGEADPNLFITSGDAVDDEPPYPNEEALSYCNRCTVRPECLRYAQDNGIEFGTWGGTSAYQRRQLRRERRRPTCVSCTSVLLLEENHRQLCIACGMSWWIAT